VLVHHFQVILPHVFIVIPWKYTGIVFILMILLLILSIGFVIIVVKYDFLSFSLFRFFLSFFLIFLSLLSLFYHGSGVFTGYACFLLLRLIRFQKEPFFLEMLYNKKSKKKKRNINKRMVRHLSMMIARKEAITVIKKLYRFVRLMITSLMMGKQL
jgi:signal transduction histidine kinase